jgi:hypothetical protein
MRTVRAVGIGVMVGLLLAVVLSVVIRGGQEGPSPRPDGPRPSGPVSAAESGPSAGLVGFLSGDGESLVPDQVQPGMYLSAGPSGTTSCYAEAVGPNGQHLAQKVQKGQTVLVVPASAASVVAHFCQPFQKVR